MGFLARTSRVMSIGSERHIVALVDEHRTVLIKPKPFSKEASGYQRLLELLWSPQDCLVAMEATGITGAIFSLIW